VKTLYMLRHAKSSWDHPGLRDHQRPLAPRGQKAAPRMGTYMAGKGYDPEYVLCSTSERTRQTWALVAPELRSNPSVEFSDEVYHASAGSLLVLATEIPDAYSSAMMIGHNPGMHAVADWLCGYGNERLLDEIGVKYPTAALAVISFDIDHWADVRAGAGTLEDFVRPRDLE
jgi:phosphohistidine phosphatase